MELVPHDPAHGSPRRSRKLTAEVGPDPAEELGCRFIAAAYRTTRALMHCRGQLTPGQSLLETPPDIFERRETIMTGTPLSHLQHLAPPPVIPQDDSSPEDLELISQLHGAAALALGFEPDDPCLHWFRTDMIGEFFPTLEALGTFEYGLIRRGGRSLINRGRIQALDRMIKELGEPSPWERRDWSLLPASFLRVYGALSMDDDRALTVARLENLRARSKESLDLRTELATEGMLAKVKGLTFVDDTKSQREILHYLGSGNGRPTAPLPQLPASG